MANAEVGASQRQYRRGAIMGLTFAEAFMLIAFALLLLFLLWRFEYERGVQIAERFQELTEKERTFFSRILENREFQTIYAVSEALNASDVEGSAASLVKVAGMLQEMPEEQRVLLEDIVASGSMENVEMVNDFVDLESPRFGAQFDEMTNRWRLMDEEAVRRIAEAVVELPEDELRMLGNLVSADGVDETLAKFAELEELFAEGRSAADIRNAVRIADEIAKAGHSDIEVLKARIKSSLTEERERQDRLTAELRASLGSQVSEFGGEIRDNGTIVIPNSVSFERGSHAMTAKFTLFLERICEPWIATLAGSEQEISEVRFEGHASAEWEGARTEYDAYLRNLELSQNRARTVFDTCFGLIDDESLRDWTEKRATAIGYSSARPVLKQDDTIDVAGSRRVEFSASFDREQVLEEIGSVVGQ